MNGQPAVGAYVTFHAADATDLASLPRSFAEVQDDGSFQLTTFRPGDGVKPGEYKVTLCWPGKLPPNSNPTDVPPDRLGGRYQSPEQPFTTITVSDQPLTLDPFHVQL